MTARRRHNVMAIGMIALLTASPCAANDEPGMVRVPGATLVLGSSLEAILRAAQICSAQAEDMAHTECAPEEFIFEVTDEEGTEVATFLLDRTEVSVADYEQCVRAGRCEGISDPRRIEAFLAPHLPVVFVRQSDASDYCAFRGARLPTEPELELAMRGPRGRNYPWGNLYHHQRANAGRTGVRTTDERDGYEMLAPTGSFPDGRAPHGALQLSGNAAEWTTSPFLPHGAPANTPSAEVTVKGGSFASAPVHLRGTSRRGVVGTTRSADIGFRCARSILRRPDDSRRHAMAPPPGSSDPQ